MMMELLRRLWRDFWYDPLVEYQRAKDLLARRLAWSEAEEHERRKSKLRLWRSNPRPKDE
jgi:hypothetical protein